MNLPKCQRANEARMFWRLVSEKRIADRQHVSTRQTVAEFRDEMDVLSLYTDSPLLRARIAAEIGDAVAPAVGGCLEPSPFPAAAHRRAAPESTDAALAVGGGETA